MEEFRKAMTTTQLQDSMKQFPEQMKTFQLQDPMKQFREQMKAIQLQDPLREFREQMKAIQLQDPLREFREKMNSIQLQDPMKQFREQMKAFQLQDPLNEFRDALKAFKLDSITNAISVYEDLSKDIIINDDGSVSINTTTLTFSEIQDIAGNIADRALNSSIVRLEQALAEIATEIKALKSSPREKILTWMLFPIIVGVILACVNPIADFYLKDGLIENQRQAEKKIKKQVITTVKDASQLASYRLVTRKTLAVRINPSANSPLLGRLYFGQVVMLVEKRRDWSLVTWTDNENSVALQGWVFSRYLSKFR